MQMKRTCQRIALGGHCVSMCKHAFAVVAAVVIAGFGCVGGSDAVFVYVVHPICDNLDD